MTGGLTRAVVSITPTKRRRFWWAAWWTAEPSADPFRPPDAFAGGARTRDEAKRAAEAAAGRGLVEGEAKWARAWVRLREGRPAWRSDKSDEGRELAPASRGGDHAPAYEVLGVAPTASDDEVKRAFQALALAHHPDRGGDATEFIRVKRAYDVLVVRRAKEKPRPRPGSSGPKPARAAKGAR